MFVELAMRMHTSLRNLRTDYMFTWIPVPRRADFPVTPVSPVNLVPRRAGFPDSNPVPRRARAARPGGPARRVGLRGGMAACSPA